MNAATTMPARYTPPLQWMIATLSVSAFWWFSICLQMEQSRSSGGARESGQPNSTTEPCGLARPRSDRFWDKLKIYGGKWDKMDKYRRNNKGKDKKVKGTTKSKDQWIQCGKKPGKLGHELTLDHS